MDNSEPISRARLRYLENNFWLASKSFLGNICIHATVGLKNRAKLLTSLNFAGKRQFGV